MFHPETISRIVPKSQITQPRHSAACEAHAGAAFSRLPILRKSGERMGHPPDFSCSRFAPLRAGLRRKEEILPFAYPALALQLASSPRDRAGLLPAVPLRGTGSACVTHFLVPEESALLRVARGCGVVRYEKNQMWCGERCESPPSSKSGEGWGTTDVLKRRLILMFCFFSWTYSTKQHNWR